ncbi:MAG: DNA alkylation repair protein [Pseudomonadota bacterium]
MTPDAAIAALKAAGHPQKAVEMAAYHKVPRTYLGVANPVIDAFARDWRKASGEDAPLPLARALWQSDIHEARVAAAKLVDRGRIRPGDGPAWRIIAGWVPDFDAWAIADHAAIAGQKRLLADPTRLNEVETWTKSPHLWTRRAAMVMTLPWARIKDPDADQRAIRTRILGWAAAYLSDPEWFIQKAVAWWLRDLSKRDPSETRAFLDAHASRMAPFARREAGKYLGT